MRLPLLARLDLCLQRYFSVAFFCSVFDLFLIFYFIPRARIERTFLSALIKKFLGVLMSIPASGKHAHTLTIHFYFPQDVIVLR